MPERLSSSAVSDAESNSERVVMILREALLAAEEGRIESALDMAAIAYEDWYGDAVS